MGSFDFIPEVIKQLGGEVIFHKVLIKPGKPALFERIGNCWLLALPGNPGYVSPKPINIEGEDQLVMIPADGAVVGMELKTGKTLGNIDHKPTRKERNPTIIISAILKKASSNAMR